MYTHAPWKLILVKISPFCIFGFAAFLCAQNFYLVFLRYRLYCFRGRKGEYRNISGWPVLPSALMIYLVIRLHLPIWALVVGVVLAVLDPGGLHWLLGSVVWQERKKARASRQHAE